MTVDKRRQVLVLRENSEWLRYVLWGCAIGMSLLVVAAINSPLRDFGKIIGSVMGVLLFSFSGFVLQTRCIVIDPIRRQIIIADKRFGQTSAERLGFDEIKKILVLTTFDNIENLRGANAMRERWSIAFVLEGRTIPVTRNLYLTKEQALRDAAKIQQAMDIEISDTWEDNIAHLTQNGKRVEAVTLACREFGMTATEAKDFVEGDTNLTAQSSVTSASRRPSP